MLLTNQFISPLSLSSLSLSPIRPKLNLPPSQLTIRAVREVHGKVIKNVNDKTVNVEVIRYRIVPKYLKRKRMKTKFQAHDPENRFKVGDLVTLEKCRPISKTKHHIAVPYKDPHGPREDQNVLDLPLQSAQ